jgi:hypothetical protein
MLQTILKCIGLSIRKSFFYLYIIIELVLIFHSIGSSGLFYFLLRNKFNSKLFFSSKKDILDYLILDRSWYNKVWGKKNFYHDIFKILVQKFIFLFFFFFPAYIEKESDFNYLFSGALFYFLKIPNSLIRFTGTILFSTVINLNSKTYSKEKSPEKNINFKKKVKRILIKNSIKELSSFGKINMLSILKKGDFRDNLIFKIKKKNGYFILFTNDILLTGINYLKIFRIIRANHNIVMLKKLYENILGLNYFHFGKIVLGAVFSSKSIKKQNLSFMLRSEESCEFYFETFFLITMNLIADCLKKNLVSFSVIFFFLQEIFFTLNFIKKHNFIIHSKGLMSKNYINLFIKRFGDLELNFLYKNYFNFRYNLKKLLTLATLDRMFKYISTNRENCNLVSIWKIQISKNIAWKFSFFSIIFRKTMNLFLDKFFDIFPFKTIILKEKFYNTVTGKFWQNIFWERIKSTKLFKLSKKPSTKFILSSYFQFLNFFLYAKIFTPILITRSSFYSKNDIMRHDMKYLMSENKKIQTPICTFFKFFYVLFLKKSIVTQPLKLCPVEKVLKRFLGNFINSFRFKKIFLVNLILNTQLLNTKINLLSRTNKLLNKDSNFIGFIQKAPIFLSVYLDLLCQISKMKKKCSEKLSLRFSIKTQDCLDIYKNYFKDKNKFKKCAFSKNRLDMVLAFIRIILNSKLFIKISSKLNLFVLDKKILKFLNLMKKFVNNQLDGSFLRFHKNSLSKIFNKKKTSDIFTFFLNNLKVNILDFFFRKNYFFFSSEKKYTDFILKLPFKTTLTQVNQ